MKEQFIYITKFLNGTAQQVNLSRAMSNIMEKLTKLAKRRAANTGQ